MNYRLNSKLFFSIKIIYFYSLVSDINIQILRFAQNDKSLRVMGEQRAAKPPFAPLLKKAAVIPNAVKYLFNRMLSVISKEVRNLKYFTVIKVCRTIVIFI